MTPLHDTNGRTADNTPYAVARPRMCDAVGSALRDAFSDQRTIPDDMFACLERLDRLSVRR